MLVKEAKAVTGGGIVSGNGKMPGATYATDPFLCEVGSKLRSVEGTSCSKCYAVKLAKFRPSVAKGYNNRHMAFARACNDIGNLGNKWVQAVAFMINRHVEKTGDKHFRWFDAGDAPHKDAFELIAQVATLTPHVKHWVPTKEVKWWHDFEVKAAIPLNLVVRVSTPKIDAQRAVKASHTSTVHKDREAIGHSCPAYTQGGTCGECRACWSPEVINVSYPLH